MKTIKLSIETSSYNQRRYGKPWIATVDFSTNSQGEFGWGEWIGDARSGSDGLLEIEATPGTIIARGQKDFRKERNSAPDYYVLEMDGSLTPAGSKADALKLSRLPLEKRIVIPTQMSDAEYIPSFALPMLAA